MNNIIAVFNNRSWAMHYASSLKKLGVPSKIINTPRELSTSCGISVVFGSRFLGQGKKIIDAYGLRDVKLYVASGDLFQKYSRIL